MKLFAPKTPEQRAADDARKRAEADQKRYQQWLRTPQGQSRLAFQRGDRVFQAVINLASVRGEIVPMVGGMTTTEDHDANQILNYVEAEGWDLITGTVVFVPTAQESRDKFMMSGQQVAITGTTVGYYLFRRREPTDSGGS